MEYLKINLDTPLDSTIKTIAKVLRTGGVIATPTDTIYGFSASIKHQLAINKIFKIKQRPKQQSLLILINSWSVLKKYCQLSKKQINYLKTVWPGPTTVIVEAKEKKLLGIKAADNSIAVRWPKNNYLQILLNYVKKPIISTSANLSGQETAKSGIIIQQQWQQQDQKPDLIVDAGLLTATASKIIDIRDLNNIKIIRA